MRKLYGHLRAVKEAAVERTLPKVSKHTHLGKYTRRPEGGHVCVREFQGG
jgi:hypothetical protein